MKLTINNIGKLKNAEVEINGITVIAGENNTGKSTVGKVLWSIFNSFYNISAKILDKKEEEIMRILSEENIFNDCEKLIDKEVELRKKAKHYEEGDESTKLSIVAESSGYLFEIKSDDIFKELNGIKAEFVINKRIGEYTTKGESVGELNIFQCKLDDNDKKELKEKLSPLFIINVYNNREEDYHRGIVNLTEIANMALSPGTNDPNTAIECINKISSLLGKLLSTGNHFIILKEDEDVKIIYQSFYKLKNLQH